MNLEQWRCWPFDDDDTYRIVGIDPGTSTLGISVIEVDSSGNLSLVWCETIKGARFLKKYPDLEEVHGSRFTRLYGYKHWLYEFFQNWQPNAVVCEANFMGRFPAAYAALTESVMVIREAALMYDVNISFTTIDPPSVKVSVGVPGKSKDKELVRQAIRNLPLKYTLPQRLPNLDEHSCDSIAVGYWRAKQHLGQ